MTPKIHITPNTGAVLAPPRKEFIDLAKELAGLDPAQPQKGLAENLKFFIKRYLKNFSEPVGQWKASAILIQLPLLLEDIDKAFFIEFDTDDEERTPEEISQPPNGVRLAFENKAVESYFAKIFGYEKRFIDNVDDRDLLKSLDGPEEFAGLLFWSELQSVLKRELKPDIDEVYRRISSIAGSAQAEIGDWKLFRARNKKRLFSLEHFKVYWMHSIVRVHETDQPEFLRAIADGADLWDISGLSQKICECRCDAFNNQLKADAHIRWGKLIENFIRVWQSGTVETFSDIEYNDPYKDKNALEREHSPIPSPEQSDSVDERLSLLDEFAVKYPGKSISQYVLELFPELAAPKYQPPPLPTKAPERWPSAPDKRTENPAEFVTRVYRVWMDAEVLTRPALGKLDPPLLASLDNWLKHNRRKAIPEPLPEGFKLLTVQQANNAWIDRVERGIEAPPRDPVEMTRFAMAVKYREESGKHRQ